MQSHFTVEVQSKDRATVLVLGGELDLASSPALEEALARAAESGAGLVIVDLRQVEFIDSTGLSVLVRAHQRAQEAGRRFGLVNGGSQVQRLLSLTGVAERILLAASPEELMSAD